MSAEKLDQLLSSVMGFEKKAMVEVHKGWLVLGKFRKQVMIFWIHRLNVEGLLTLAKETAVELGFQTLLSLVPGGSVAHYLVMEKIGVPPKQNMVFLPNVHRIQYGTISLSKEGTVGGIFDTVAKTTVSISKKLFETGQVVGKELSGLVGLRKEEEEDTNLGEGEEMELSFGFLRFLDLLADEKRRLLDKKKEDSEDTLDKLQTRLERETTMPFTAEFKTTAEEDLKRFLKAVQKEKFQVEFL